MKSFCQPLPTVRLAPKRFALLAVAVASQLYSASLFHPSQVQVTEGRFRDSIETNVDYVLAHDPDRLLAPFRTAAGLEPKAEKYGNWESSGLDGHSAGHFLSAYATLSLASDNPLLGQRLDYMLDELAACQEAFGDGYVGGVPNSKSFKDGLAAGTIDAQRFSLNGAWVPWYNLHKTYAGLKDAWLIADREKAKEILIGLADWTVAMFSNITDEQVQEMLYAEHGGMNEIFADLYLQTGDKRYLEVAYRFTHKELLDPLLAREDKLTGFHANTQIPKVIGLERIALAADDQPMHDAALFFWDNVVNHRSVSIGGNSVREHFHPTDDFSSMVESREGPETCNTHNMMRLTDTIFQVEPSAELVDYYERALFNHILSSQHPETGGLVYFTPMRPRHYRVYSVPEDAFWCCVGSGIENSGRYSEFIYAHTDDALFVNLFIPSVLDWQDKGLRLKQTTDFPDSETTRLTIEQAPKKRLTLKVRKPDWVTNAFSVSLNGKKLDAKITSDGYASITSKWKAGDTLSIDLPMELGVSQLPDGSNFVSYSYGPIVLAADMGDEATPGLFAGSGRMEHIAPGPYLPLDKAPMLIGEVADALDFVHPVPNESLRFKLSGDIRPAPASPILLQPFNGLHESRYSIYWQIVDESDYAAIQNTLQQQEAARLALAARTVDSVAAGEQQSEVEHDYSGTDTFTNAHLGERFRAANGSFSYNLRSESSVPLELAVTIFGSEWGKSCAIKIGDQVIGSIDLRAQHADKFREETFDVPPELAKGDQITVTVEATNDQPTPMVFEISLRRKE